MKKPSLKKIRPSSAKSEDQPATRKMLRLVRDELKHDLKRIETKFDAKFDQMDAKFTQMDAKSESRFDRMELLFEEQNANNRIVLEGLQALWQRQDRVEERLTALESNRSR